MYKPCLYSESRIATARYKPKHDSSDGCDRECPAGLVHTGAVSSTEFHQANTAIVVGYHFEDARCRIG